MILRTRRVQRATRLAEFRIAVEDLALSDRHWD
jgi:hypothetical protein